VTDIRAGPRPARVRRTRGHLADGRGLIYFDDSEPFVSGRSDRSFDEVADAAAGTPPDDALRSLVGDEAFRLARHVVSEMHRVDALVDVLLAGHVDRIGPLLDGSHCSLRDDFAVSCAERDLAVDAAREAGALGARMTGGGFGGSAIALVPSTAATDVATSVDRSFVAAGFGRPAFLLATPSGPTGRVR
jgi:UDPglucose--hexose-1-phosphate uridylyltransferase